MLLYDYFSVYTKQIAQPHRYTRRIVVDYMLVVLLLVHLLVTIDLRESLYVSCHLGVNADLPGIPPMVYHVTLYSKVQVENPPKLFL